MVTLNGGDLGGAVVAGEGWTVGEVRVFDGLRYRRDAASAAALVAVVCGDCRWKLDSNNSSA